jgi:hypothetical protein
VKNCQIRPSDKAEQATTNLGKGSLATICPAENLRTPSPLFARQPMGCQWAANGLETCLQSLRMVLITARRRQYVASSTFRHPSCLQVSVRDLNVLEHVIGAIETAGPALCNVSSRRQPRLVPRNHWPDDTSIRRGSMRIGGGRARKCMIAESQQGTPCCQ